MHIIVRCAMSMRSFGTSGLESKVIRMVASVGVGGPAGPQRSPSVSGLGSAARPGCISPLTALAESSKGEMSRNVKAPVPRG